MDRVDSIVCSLRNRSRHLNLIPLCKQNAWYVIVGYAKRQLQSFSADSFAELEQITGAVTNGKFAHPVIEILDWIFHYAVALELLPQHMHIVGRGI